jgi:putative membrane protein
MPEDWWVENGLVFLFIGVLVVTYRWLPLSQLSYLLILIYLSMHEWGAHYRYAIDPIGEWMRQIFHTVRNDFDRVTHFSFGLLMSYPHREMLLRKAGMRRSWALWIPILMIGGYSAIYEIIEAAAAGILSKEAGDAFLALQGDPWDTQKDMLMALLGSVVATVITAAFATRQPKSAETKAEMTTVGAR